MLASMKPWGASQSRLAQSSLSLVCGPCHPTRCCKDIAGLAGVTPLKPLAPAGASVRCPDPGLDLDDLSLFEADARSRRTAPSASPQAIPP